MIVPANVADITSMITMATNVMKQSSTDPKLSARAMNVDGPRA